jgi:beta-glucosidase-like glycosyl hydrolase
MMQVLGCLKHFPGHGNTNVDSHLGLPVLKKR